MRRALLFSFLFFIACQARDDGDAVGADEQALRGSAFSDTTVTSLPTSAQLCGPGRASGCYTNYGVVADLDGDGKLDLVFANGGDHFVPGLAEPQAVFFGDGAGKFAVDAAAFTGVNAIAPSIVRQVAIADFDGDGRLDVYFPGGYGLHDDQLFMQTTPRHFENQAAARLGVAGSPITRSRAGAVHAADIDDDGDMDLLIADWGHHPNPDSSSTPVSPVKIRVLENDGTGHFTPKTILDVPLSGSSATDIDLVDINNDFSLDIVLTNRNGQSRIYTNDGKGIFTDVTVTKAFPVKRGPFTFNAELCDIDGDGDLDLLFDGGARFLTNHSTQVLVNDGTGVFTDETTLRIPTEPRSDDNQVKCADIDNDGHFDLIVASLSNPTEKLLRNTDGLGHFQLVANAFPTRRDPTLGIDLGDFDGDGKVDLMTAQGEVRGQSWLERIFKNVTPSALDAANRKPIFRRIEDATISSSKPTTVHLAVSGTHTSETGQHVAAVTIDLDIDAQPRQSLPARFMGGDLFRAVLPPTTSGSIMKLTPRATLRSGQESIGPTQTITITVAAPPPRL